MVWGIPWTEKERRRKANILFTKILEKLTDTKRKTQILPKEKTRRGELGGWRKEPRAHPNQQSVQKKEQLVELLKKIWRFISVNSFKLYKARPKDKFPLSNIDLLIDPTKATTISTIKRHTMVRELKSFLEIVSYIRKFSPRPAFVTSGLSKLLKKGNVSI